MGYKTLLTFIAREAAIGPTIDSAVALARREDAHLDVCCLGVDHTQTGYFYAGAPAMIYQEALDRARDAADALREKVQARLGREDIRWAADSAVVQLGALAGLVGARARFSDLVIQTKPYGEDRGIEEEAIVEASLFEGQAPVLVLPRSGLINDPPRRIVVAWNQGSEALSAVRRALPMLQTADSVNIAIIDPPRHSAERSDPGGQLTQMLARHGVRAEISVLARSTTRVSDLLLRHLADQDADLLVMGAYGHSRFREAIMGGTTRDMLEQADRPVFMAH